METRATSGSGRFKSVDPTKAILPVLLLDTAKGKIKDLLGTGFFFSDRPTILSCAHVLGTTPGPDELIGVPRYQGPDAEPGVIAHHEVLALLSNVRRHPIHDLAVADVGGVAQFEHFTFRSSDPSGKTPTLMTVDLASRTTFEPGPIGEPVWTINPYTWKGYAHTTLISQEIGMQAAAKILEVSIPVVKGMSGAPFIEEETLEVAGVLFGNVARSLVPAPQAETDGQAWYLPIGQAFSLERGAQILRIPVPNPLMSYSGRLPGRFL